jgi:HD domain
LALDHGIGGFMVAERERVIYKAGEVSAVINCGSICKALLNAVAGRAVAARQLDLDATLAKLGIYSQFGRLGVGLGLVTGRLQRPDVVARLPKTRAALDYATRQHAWQRRSSDGAAFIEHPLEVGWLLYRAGAPDHVIAAGVLHDVIEKTDVSGAELSARFGLRIADLVRAVSEDGTISGYQRRKAALRQQVAAAGPEALMIFAADKVSKVGELRSALSEAARRHESRADSLVPLRRLAHFRRCLGMLEERLGDSQLVHQLGTALAGLDRDLKTSAAIRAAA